jgi:hypothetical protein
MFWNVVKGASALIVVLGLFFGVYKYIDGRYALAKDVADIEHRLDYKIAKDQKIDTEKEMSQIEERNLGKPESKWDIRDRARYKALKSQLQDIMLQIQNLLPGKK